MEKVSLSHNIEVTIWNYIRDNYLPRSAEVNLGVDENLFDAGIIDSAGLISFVGFLERNFGVTIPDEDLLPENFASLKAMTSYIIEKTRTVAARE